MWEFLFQCTESGLDLSRDIQVADGQEDHVGEGVQAAKAAGAILDHADDAVETFGGRIGQASVYERQDTGLVSAKGMDEAAQRFEAAPQGRGGPALEEGLGGMGG